MARASLHSQAGRTILSALAAISALAALRQRHYNLSGTGMLSASSEYVSVFTQSGGTNTVKSSLSLSGSGTYNLIGGVLLVPFIKGAGIFNLGGGTLMAGGFSTGEGMTLTGSGGNGNIDTNGGYPLTLSVRYPVPAD